MTQIPLDESDPKVREHRAQERRYTLKNVLRRSTTPVDMAGLVEELGLGAELDELGRTSPERQRGIEMARAQLELELPRPI